MKKQLFILLFFTLCFAQAQHAIKIYVTDAVTGRNVTKAKVTLEGFEIPEIIGKYNRKGKYYYFDAIPAGYNTVMVYPKNHNEKGFQNINGLPAELHLSLSSKYCNSSRIFYNAHKNCDNYRTSPITSEYYKTDDYVEDPYKIIISTKGEYNYNKFIKTIKTLIKTKNIPIEMVNPYVEYIKITYPNKVPNTSYPDSIFKDTRKNERESNFFYDWNLGFFRSSQLPSFFQSHFGKRLIRRDFHSRDSLPNDVCVFFRKSDGSKFKRFNDPVLKILKENNLIFYNIILPKISSDILRTKENIKLLAKYNDKFNSQHNIDSSKVFVWRSTYVKNLKIYGEESDQIPKDYWIIPQNFYCTYKDINEYRMLLYEKNFAAENGLYCLPDCSQDNFVPYQDESIGLGILDNYEYYLNQKYK